MGKTRYNEPIPEKKKIRKEYGANLSKVFYLLLESKIIEEQLQKVVNVLNEKMALRDFVIVQAINSLCRLQFSYADICRFVNISDSLLQSYAMDEDVREILDNDRQRFVISSAIYTQYLVRQSNMKKEMIEVH